MVLCVSWCYVFQVNRDHLPAQCEVAKHMLSSASTDRHLSAVDVYKKLSAVPAAFPDILACFRVALTLPVASATAERSFSAMRRIKTHLRASLSGNKLSSLALIAVERQLSDQLIKDPAAVIDVFASLGSGKRQLDFLL